MIVVDIISQPTTIEVSTRQIVAGGTPAPGTVNVVDADNNPLDSVTVASGGTETVTITSSEITRSDDSVITELLAQQPYQVGDTEVVLVDTAGNPLSTNNVKADSTAEIEAPDGTVTAQNSLGTPVGTVEVKSGGTDTIPISDTQINRSNGSNIGSTPSGVPFAVAVSPVRVEHLNGMFISDTDVLAATATTIQVPNPLTLQDNVNSSTSAQIVTAVTTAGKECEVTSLFLNNYGATPRVLGLFATVTTNGLSVAVNGNIAYVLNNNAIDLYNATSFAFIGSVLGFQRAGEIAFNATSYVVVNFSNNTARLMDLATNTEITSFPVISNPLSVCFSPDGTLIYVASLTSASTISYYNLSGVLQGTVPGFDAVITEMRAVNDELWVLTGTGTTGANTQRVRKMRFSDNTQLSTHSLGTVASIGAIRAMVVTATKVFVSFTFGSQFVYRIICYNLDFTSPVTLNVGLVGQAAYGLTANPNRCDTFIMINPNAETCYNLAL
jgi:hypothetical protein